MMCMRAEGGWGRVVGGVRKRRGSQDREVQMSSGQMKRNEQFKGMKMFTFRFHGPTRLYKWNLDTGNSLIIIFLLLCFYEIGSSFPDTNNSTNKADWMENWVIWEKTFKKAATRADWHSTRKQIPVTGHAAATLQTWLEQSYWEGTRICLSTAVQADHSICRASMSQSRMDEGAGLFSRASPHMLLSGGCTAQALTWLQPRFSSGRWVWEMWLFLLALLDDLPG